MSPAQVINRNQMPVGSDGASGVGGDHAQITTPIGGRSEAARRREAAGIDDGVKQRAKIHADGQQHARATAGQAREAARGDRARTEQPPAGGTRPAHADPAPSTRRAPELPHTADPNKSEFALASEGGVRPDVSLRQTTQSLRDVKPSTAGAGVDGHPDLAADATDAADIVRTQVPTGFERASPATQRQEATNRQMRGHAGGDTAPRSQPRTKSTTAARSGPGHTGAAHRNRSTARPEPREPELRERDTAASTYETIPEPESHASRVTTPSPAHAGQPAASTTARSRAASKPTGHESDIKTSKSERRSAARSTGGAAASTGPQEAGRGIDISVNIGADGGGRDDVPPQDATYVRSFGELSERAEIHARGLEAARTLHAEVLQAPLFDHMVGLAARATEHLVTRIEDLRPQQLSSLLSTEDQQLLQQLKQGFYQRANGVGPNFRTA